MLRDYTPLEAVMLQPGVGYGRPAQVLPERVTLDDPAIHVMTDFNSLTAVISASGKCARLREESFVSSE